MKIQLAIDRVSMEEAEMICAEAGTCADIVEIGTSLIKDFGLSGSVGRIRKAFPELSLLADIKTCDEGAYEFARCFEAGADIATVMGFSSDTTIEACAAEASKAGKDYLIDLLELSKERVRHLVEAFPDAIFGIHLPADLMGEGLEELVRDLSTDLAGVKTAAAGGVKLENLAALRDAGIDTVIVGGAITKAADRAAAARAFAETIR